MKRIHEKVLGRTDCRMRELHEGLQKRLRRNIPLAEVARAIGVDKRALEKWYNNELDVYHGAIIAVLCHYYGVTVDQLLVPHVSPVLEEFEPGQWLGREPVYATHAPGG